MKNRLRSALVWFLVSFFAYFRYLLVVAVVLLIGSIFFHPLLYAGLLSLSLDVIFSAIVTLKVLIVIPIEKEKFVFGEES